MSLTASVGLKRYGSGGQSEQPARKGKGMEELKSREYVLVRHIETRVPRADSGDNRAKQDIRLDTHALVRHHGWNAWQVADLIECVRLVGAE